MATQKSERLLKLLIMLLVQQRYVSKDKVRELLYAGSGDEAFERMFERDKDDLRALGVPIEVGSLDTYFDDEPGYRVRPDEAQLPQIELTADEAHVVGLATKVWEHARLAEATTEGVRKLVAAGHPVDVGALDLVGPRLGADEPAFDVFWEATQDRCEVEFDYQRPGGEVATRRIQPWGVVRYSGRWYAVGNDLDRGEERVFRLSRVRGPARRVGEPRAYEIPVGLDIRDVTRRFVPPESTEPVTLLIRAGSGHAFRRAAASVTQDVAGPDTDTTWDRVVLDRGGLDLADEVLAHGPDVLVESPPALREAVVRRLTAVVETAS